jgi:ethanolamine utilization microcompartment shell protein EutL
VQSIVPDLGSTAGNTDIVITGTNFGTVKGDVKVVIDKIECAVSAVTNTEIKCKTGARPKHTQ